MLNTLRSLLSAQPIKPIPPEEPRPHMAVGGRGDTLTVTLNLRWLEELARTGDGTALSLIEALDYNHMSGDWGGGDYPVIECNQRNLVDLVAVISRAAKS